MIEINFAWRFVLCALAIWRVAHLLAWSNGPMHLIERMRASLGSSTIGRLMDNFYSWSFLLSLPPAIWMSSSRMVFFVQWLALSVVVCLLEWATQGTQRRLSATSVSNARLDEVIRGV
jgi:hypothetical protein